MAVALLVAVAVALLVAVRGDRRLMMTGQGAMKSLDHEADGSEKQSLHQPPASSHEQNDEQKASDAALALNPEDCKQLAILMSGENKRHLEEQALMYEELSELSEYYPTNCIVVVTYNGGKAPDADGYVPNFPDVKYQILGEYFKPFVEGLHKATQNRSVKFDGVFLSYYGHGGTAAIYTHKNADGMEGTDAGDFMKLVTKLNEMANHVLLVVSACHSSSMFLQPGAQLLSNQESIYGASSLLSDDDWPDDKLQSELCRLTEHYSDLNEVMRGMLESLLRFAKMKQSSATENKDMEKIMGIAKAFAEDAAEPNFKASVEFDLNMRKIKLNGTELELGDCPTEEELSAYPLTSRLIFAERKYFTGTILCNHVHAEFKSWSTELTTIFSSIFDKPIDAEERQKIKKTAGMGLLGLFRLSVPYLAKPKTPVDLLKKTDSCMAITSSAPTTVCHGASIAQAVRIFLKKRRIPGCQIWQLKPAGKKECKEAKALTMQDMYDYIRTKFLEDWYRKSDDDDRYAEALKRLGDGEFIVKDLLTGDLHKPRLHPKRTNYPAFNVVGFGEMNLKMPCETFFPLGEASSEETSVCSCTVS